MANGNVAAFLAARYAEAWTAARDRELTEGLDTSRSTRDIEAKRNILAEHAADDHWCARPPDPDWVVYEGGRRVVKVYPCGTLRDLAAEFSDHPDHDQALGL